MPLGVYRTWVKYVETGSYPNSRRHFQVTRCNHCANPPCVRICPVSAMYQRDDGIVEFDSSACIGCKACLQACPYDAIYIDPESKTAAKCHYCAHRTDIGLEPACVVVCPERAIIAGDMNDADSEISTLLAREDVTVRKPEQGTSPKLFYISGNDVVLHPTATERAPETFMWADVIPLNGHGQYGGAEKARPNLGLGRPAQPQGRPLDGPIQIGDRVAEQMVQVAYNAQHKIPWHWQVPAYLVTKGIGSGLMMLLSLGIGLKLFVADNVIGVSAGILALISILLTTGLLVHDLEKPDRFIYILLRPQWRSWLTRGALILIAFSALTGIWWALEVGTALGWWELAAQLRSWMLWLDLPLAVGVAVYTAFLFAQAEGRDLWQSPLLPFHLTIQAFVAGSGALLVLNLFLDYGDDLLSITRVTFIVALLIDLFVTMIGEFSVPHASEIAARAAHEISHGKYRRHYWIGGITIGHVVPLLLLIMSSSLVDSPVLGVIAGLCAIVGLFAYEYAFVMAPQEIPNS